MNLILNEERISYLILLIQYNCSIKQKLQKKTNLQKTFHKELIILEIG